MKIILTLLILLTVNLEAAQPPTQKTVDEWAVAAQKLTEEQIRGSPKPKWSCEYAIVRDKQFSAFGENQQDALNRTALLCIKHQCNTIGEKMSRPSELDSLNDADYRRALRGFGYNSEEIEIAIANRTDKDRTSRLKQVNCLNGTPGVRTFAVDSCFVLPFSCGKVKKIK